MAAGSALRAAQIAAIEQPGSGEAHVRQARERVRTAGEIHRAALSDAVHQATRLAAQAEARASGDALTRALEALSLAPASEAPGRLTDVVQPAGLEALAGVTPAPRASVPEPVRRPEAPPSRPTGRPSAQATAARERLGVEIAKRTAALDAARDAERSARDEAARAERDLHDAERAVGRLRGIHADKQAAADRAAAALDAAERALGEIAKV